MLNLAVILCLTLSASGSGPASPSDTVLRAAPLRVRDSSLRQPLPFLDSAAEEYEQLLEKSRSERRHRFREMPSSLKSGVWAHHLLTMLVRHPELTSEQRALIQDALSLLTPEWFEIEPANPQWETLVDEPLRRLHQRARVLFDPRVARELFSELGPDPLQRENEHIASARTPTPPGAALLRLVPISHTDPAPDCECSVTSDWCSNWGNFRCLNTWCVFFESGCGTFFRFACEGLCRPT